MVRAFPLPPQVPSVAVHDANVNPLGRLSETVTVLAPSGPRLATSRPKVTVSPGRAVAEETPFVRLRSAAGRRASNAPMSKPGPTGRATPRWSVGREVAGSATSTAGLV